MSSTAIETKKVQVQEIAEKFQTASSVVVVDYRGLTVAQVTELRKQLREAGECRDWQHASDRIWQAKQQCSR